MKNSVLLCLVLGACAGGGAGQGDSLRAGVITASGDHSVITYTVNVTIEGAPTGGPGGTASPNTSVPITVPIQVGPGGIPSLPVVP